MSVWKPEDNSKLVIWTIAFAVLLIILLPAKCYAQQVVCNRQPMSGLEYKDNGKKFEAAEWHCVGNEQQAFALLSQSNIGPFTPATTTRFAEFTNKASFREKLLKGALYVSTFVGPLAALPGISEVAYKALLGGAPIAARILTEVAGGLPKAFESTQSSGYSVVYSMASNQNRIVQNTPLPTSIQPARSQVPLEFVPASWYTLYQETLAQGRREVIHNWKVGDIHWSQEWRREMNENFYMNEAEALAFIRGYREVLLADAN